MTSLPRSVYLPEAIVYKITLNLARSNEEHQLPNFDLGAGYNSIRFQYFPELIYQDRNEKWLRFLNQQSVTCDIRKLQEGHDAQMVIKNTSQKSAEVTFSLIAHLPSQEQDESSQSLLHSTDFSVISEAIRDGIEQVFSEDESPVDGASGLRLMDIQDEIIWGVHDVSNSSEPSWFQNVIDTDDLLGMEDFIRKRTSVFNSTITQSLVYHQKTFAALAGLDDYLEMCPPSPVITYVGLDTGENFLSVWNRIANWEKGSPDQSAHLNVIWTPWDQRYGRNIRDWIDEKRTSNQTDNFGFSFTFNGDKEIIDYPSKLRSDFMIFTYVVPWMTDFKVNMDPYKRMEMKPSTKLLVVNPTTLSRDHGNASTPPSDDDWKSLGLEVVKNWRVIDQLVGCTSRFYGFGASQARGAATHAGPNYVSEIEIDEDKSEPRVIEIDSFTLLPNDIPCEVFSSGVAQIPVVPHLSRTHYVFFVDGIRMKKNLNSNLNVEQFGRTLIDSLGDNKVLWDGIHLLCPCPTPIHLFEESQRRRIALLIKRAEIFSNSEMKKITDFVHANYEQVDTCFLKRKWIPTNDEFVPSNRLDAELRKLEPRQLTALEKIAAIVIGQLIESEHELRFTTQDYDSYNRWIQFTEELKNVFSIYETNSPSDKKMFQIDCYSTRCLNSIIEKVNTNSTVNTIRLRINSMGHTVDYDRNDWDKYCSRV